MKTNYPDKMSDSEAWDKHFRSQYRMWPSIVLCGFSLVLFPFAMVYWAALHFEAIQDVLAERWDDSDATK